MHFWLWDFLNVRFGRKEFLGVWEHWDNFNNAGCYLVNGANLLSLLRHDLFLELKVCQCPSMRYFAHLAEVLWDYSDLACQSVSLSFDAMQSRVGLIYFHFYPASEPARDVYLKALFISHEKSFFALSLDTSKSSNNSFHTLDFAWHHEVEIGRILH